MADTVRVEHTPEGSSEPLTLLVDAIAEYKDIDRQSVESKAPTLHELGIGKSVDINTFVTSDTTGGKLAFWWDDMYVTVHTTGTITVTGDGPGSVANSAAD